MRPIDPHNSDSAAILPFAPRAHDERLLSGDHETGDAVSTIVAIVAVTLRHDKQQTPEDRLADLIEATGQADIIEIQDAYDDVIDGADASHMRFGTARNDNAK